MFSDNLFENYNYIGDYAYKSTNIWVIYKSGLSSNGKILLSIS